MNIEQKLNEIVAALDELKIPHLVMGGHAVRYFGLGECDKFAQGVRKSIKNKSLHLMAPYSRYMGAQP